MSKALNSAALVKTATGQAPDTNRVAALAETYKDLLGFIPPRVNDRLNITSVLDPQSMEMQEAIRTHAMETPCFDPKTTQIDRKSVV